MNKETIDKIENIISDYASNYDGCGGECVIAQEIISLCADEAIEAVKEKAKQCRIYGNIFNYGDAIEAIEKRMK